MSSADKLYAAYQVTVLAAMLYGAVCGIVIERKKKRDETPERRNR